MKKRVSILLCVFLVGMLTAVASPDSFENDVGKQRSELFEGSSFSEINFNVEFKAPMMVVEYTITKTTVETDVFIFTKKEAINEYFEKVGTTKTKGKSEKEENYHLKTHLRCSDLYQFKFVFRPTESEYSTSHYYC